MTLHSAQLRRQADAQLQKADYSPKKMVLIHTAVSLGASLLIAFVNYLFFKMMEDTGGLSGMGTRSLLETAQVLLELAVMVLLPFWNIGLIRAVLCWTRGESAQPPTLLEGFRRMGSVLGMNMLTAVLVFAIGFATVNVAGLVMAFAPFSQKLLELMQPLMDAANAGQNPEDLLTEELANQIVQAAIPMLVTWLLLFAAVMIPVAYRIRFGEFFLMDDKGPLTSLLESVRITKGAVWQVIKLDLSFWWFYLLQFLSVAICYTADFLPLEKLPFSVSGDLAYYFFYTLGILCQGVLLVLCQAKVSTTYGLAYDALRTGNPAVSQEDA